MHTGDLAMIDADGYRPLQVPRYVKFVHGFPMTVTGKLRKFLMRQQMIDELGLSVQETA